VAIERDKFLAESMGMCWHEIVTINDGRHNFYICRKCGTSPIFKIDSFITPNFSEIAWFDSLYNWVTIDKRFGPMFMGEYNPMNKGPISPDQFANLVYMFLMEQETSCEKSEVSLIDKIKGLWKK
jgi:hypothetical protein